MDWHDILGSCFAYSVVIGIISIIAMSGYLLYSYLEIDTVRLALFILITSIAASIWQLASSYNKFPLPAAQHHITTVSGFTGWQILHTPRVYILSPDGTKSDTAEGIPLQTSNTTERGKRVSSRMIKNVIKRVTVCLIRVFYGPNESRIAVVGKSVATMEEGEISVSSTETYHRYVGDTLRYPYESAGPTDNLAMIDMQTNKYSKKPCTIEKREVVEYTSGHKIVRKLKMETSIHK